MRRLASLALAAACLLAPATAQAQSVQLAPFGGPYVSPYFVAGEPGNPSRVYVVEGAGRIRLVVDGTTQAGDFLDITGDVCFSSDTCGSESGLFSMAFAPDYATTGLFYVFFTRDATPEHDLVIREFQRTTDPNDIDEATGRDVIVIPHPDAANHNGGQLQFGPDGLLYISIGDGGSTPGNGQLLTTRLGKLLRINPADPPGVASYSVPADNPFVDGEPGGNADEIYSYGLRNPYRFSFDRLTGDLTLGDVGLGAREEIDFLANGGARGVNFGWVCFEGTQPTGSCGTLPSNHTPPVLEYTRSGSSAAVNGGYVVRDTALPSLLGRYLYADTFDALNNEIRSAQLFPGGSSGDAPTGLTANFVVSFGEDACGHVYVAHGNTVSRIEPTSGPFPCAPQVAIQPPQVQGDLTAPVLGVDVGKGKRAAARGKVTLVVTCNEGCTLRGEGEIVLQGKDIGLDPDSGALPAGATGRLHLELSAKQARRLRRVLLDGGKATAVVGLTAADAAGNRGTATHRIKQKL